MSEEDKKLISHGASERTATMGEGRPGGLDGADSPVGPDVDDALDALLDNATARAQVPSEDFAILCDLGEGLRRAVERLRAERDQACAGESARAAERDEARARAEKAEQRLLESCAAVTRGAAQAESDLAAERDRAEAADAERDRLREALTDLLESVDLALCYFPVGSIAGGNLRGFLLGAHDRSRAALSSVQPASAPPSATSPPGDEAPAKSASASSPAAAPDTAKEGREP